jgi:hypothetical protein
MNVSLHLTEYSCRKYFNRVSIVIYNSQGSEKQKSVFSRKTEEYGLLDYNCLWFGGTYRLRLILPASAGSFLGLLFSPEDEGDVLLCNIGSLRTTRRYNTETRPLKLLEIVLLY